MADAWDELQQIKNKRLSLREKLAQRKREREDILSATGTAGTKDALQTPAKVARTAGPALTVSPLVTISPGSAAAEAVSPAPPISDGHRPEAEADPADVERQLVRLLAGLHELPTDGRQLAADLAPRLSGTVTQRSVNNVLQKLAAQDLISVQEVSREGGDRVLEVSSVEHVRLQVVAGEGGAPTTDEPPPPPAAEAPRPDDIMNLLALPSAREKENKKMGEEILDLLCKPTVKERSTAERFRSQGGAQVQEYCRHGTREECDRSNKENANPCGKLHFRKILQKHTDESLGDCSFLNTCFHMDTCKYVHYEVDYSGLNRSGGGGDASDAGVTVPLPAELDRTVLFPPQWIQCDLRFFDMSVIGECAVIMADPPWDIHMELPYGTMADDEMRNLDIPSLQPAGLIFLWVTGRAMELGRECLTLWGYERVDELIWVKSNQLQRIIRTGRTGHWLNHGKEHCLVGMKGEPQFLNRGLDADVLVAEVRATSHKPDEIYGIIERLSPGTRKLELFGRPHNAQPNWITLGNQLDGVNLSDPEIVERFKKRYPDGDCLKPPP
ncbi:LOW QUALITY PROTEIN: N6-adenosine-methyltransferase subunit METTL3-like [Amphibalanus amphitrite]|uniref:LOW QUALITY PROTEIN: N6-adenosine-methyltransferase subunit METTL3-like n=1 Tax=Amphibalanus amphitrite TaxID=1232801 RepID=UPI001C92B382|nr:LOW QUALITY PROTEIN: N6-adenosine-methyltransferase subunit METTL3-like [Amphibalanus amphitrite]